MDALNSGMNAQINIKNNDTAKTIFAKILTSGSRNECLKPRVIILLDKLMDHLYSLMYVKKLNILYIYK
jgi:hypothetical protein